MQEQNDIDNEYLPTLSSPGSDKASEMAFPVSH